MRECTCGGSPELRTATFREVLMGPCYVEVRFPECGATTGLGIGVREAWERWEAGNVARYREWLEEMADD